MSILEHIHGPADLRALRDHDLATLADEIRTFLVDAVSKTGGHLGSNLGAVELTLALHRVFDSPRDILLWDTGHQTYVHKLVTGRAKGFATLRQADGLSGYPKRAESRHDWVENSHASTILSYAHGLATARDLGRGPEIGAGPGRRIVAVIGDGALTGGLSFEALNNLGHAGTDVVIVVNDNGRSYAPTVSKLCDPPGPAGFFEALGLHYTGPVDGHDIAQMEASLASAAARGGPIVVHVVTRKGKGYAPAEQDTVQHLHDLKVPPAPGSQDPRVASFTEAFGNAMVEVARRRLDVVAITAAMPGSTGLLPFATRFPDRFFDVGIAEAHAVTAAAGMAMGGLTPVVALYASFFSRAFDQANLDVGLHRLPVVFAIPSAGITGPNGPSHHGVLDLAQCLAIPELVVLAPSSPGEVPVMLDTALALGGPVAIRFPSSPTRPGAVGSGLHARQVFDGDGSVCVLAVGKMVAAAEAAARLLAAEGVRASVWDVRTVRPPDPAMLADAASHELVVTVEDGIRIGGAGSFLADALQEQSSGRQRRVLCLGLPHAYLPHADPAVLLARLGLDGPGLAATVLGARPTVVERQPALAP